MVTRRDDVQVGRYAYRVLRPVRPLRRAVLTGGGELRAARRDGLRMLALAELGELDLGYLRVVLQ